MFWKGKKKLLVKCSNVETIFELVYIFSKVITANTYFLQRSRDLPTGRPWGLTAIVDTHMRVGLKVLMLEVCWWGSILLWVFFHFHSWAHHIFVKVLVNFVHQILIFRCSYHVWMFLSCVDGFEHSTSFPI